MWDKILILYQILYKALCDLTPGHCKFSLNFSILFNHYTSDNDISYFPPAFQGYSYLHDRCFVFHLPTPISYCESRDHVWLLSEVSESPNTQSNVRYILSTHRTFVTSRISSWKPILIWLFLTSCQGSCFMIPNLVVTSLHTCCSSSLLVHSSFYENLLFWFLWNPLSWFFSNPTVFLVGILYRLLFPPGDVSFECYRAGSQESSLPR